MAKKILIVDDESDIRELLSVRLKHAGFDIEEAQNGREAIGAFIEGHHNRPFDLVLLDIMMPGLNGLDVLRILRSEEENRGIDYGSGVPIIMITALKEPWMESFKCGCDDYIIKPYKPEDLMKKIAEKLA